MTQVAIRQSGGACIISIPKVILRTLALGVGASLDLSIEDNKIILTPIKESLTLEAILEGSPKERGFNNIRFLTCLFVRLLRCKNSCVASYAPVSTP